MNSKRLWVTTAILFALSASGPHSSGVWAQTEQATCAAGWDWNENSLGQDPCLISSMLDAECRGIAIYTIPPLNSTQNYVPPQRDSTSDLRCDCDSVMYSLYMACSTCQGGRIYSWIRWIAQCDSVYVTQYPHDIPPGTAVPRWAYYNVTTLPDQTYNDTVAMSIGRDPEATPRPGTTVSSRTSTRRSSTVSTRTSTSRPTGGVTSGRSKTNVGAIVGGVVGGVVPLIILAVGVFFYMKRRKQNQQPPPPPPPHQEVSEYYKVQPASPVLSPTSASLPYNTYYNPGDPTTYPSPVGDGHSSMTYTNPLSPVHGSQGQGRYAGIPEV